MEKFTVSAPGKIILHGEHSVVYGKTAVALSLNLRTILTVTACNTSSVEFSLSTQDEATKTWSIQELMSLKTSIPGDPKNPAALSEQDYAVIWDFLSTNNEPPTVINRISLAFIYLCKAVFTKLQKCSGLRVIVSSCLPIGAGLGSSASIAVCLAAALLQLEGNLTLTDTGTAKSCRDATGSDQEFHFTPTDLDLVNRWAFMVEKIFHGNPSGVDNCTCTYGGAVVYRKGQFNPMKVNMDIRILVVNTKVSRNTKEIVSRVRTLRDKYPTIIDAILEAMDQVAIMFETTLRDAQCSDASNNHRSIFEDLIDINQVLLNAINVSHPKLEEIVSTSKKYGFHAKLTGAGGGGVAFVLLRPDAPHENVEELQQDLIQQRFECWEVTVGGSGVQLQKFVLKEI